MSWAEFIVGIATGWILQFVSAIVMGLGLLVAIQCYKFLFGAIGVNVNINVNHKESEDGF